MKFYWIDAFTDIKMGGNPCAVFIGADHLSTEKMQEIAKEMNLSETAFVVSSSQADFGARYFTPAEEIPLAGHPTLSTIKALIENGDINTKFTNSVSLELPAGIIQVDICSQTSNIVMSQKKPEFLSHHDKGLIVDLFSLEREDFFDSIPVQTVSTGTPQLMVLVKSQDALKRAAMKVEKYKVYKKNSDFFSPHLFCLQGFTEEGNTSARHFGVPPDTMEDAFTGSATGGMAAFLWHYELINESKFIAEQGHWMGRPGRALVEVLGSPADIETVKVGGKAVKLMEGKIDLSSEGALL